uniref:Fucolectin tachylectin-4 pentraxin-1 domain-containing protein n=1 Tax=Astyanax mexicanus TaxID=7994 RepID=A0A8B9JSQ7_ASTMX
MEGLISYVLVSYQGTAGSCDLAKSSVQSSTYDFLGDAANAVDGNSNTDYLKKSCSHTHFDNNPWLRVELPDVYNVTSVTIVNRKDCCGDRINGAQIRIGNSLDNKVNAFEHVVKFVALTCFFFCIYRVAVIGPMGSERKILTLCEVKVYAGEREDKKEPEFIK